VWITSPHCDRRRSRGRAWWSTRWSQIANHQGGRNIAGREG
jgi:hypothetical protein